MCYFFQKIKKIVQFSFEKKIVVQKERNNNLSRGKIPAPPPPWISNGPSLNNLRIELDLDVLYSKNRNLSCGT